MVNKEQKILDILKEKDMYGYEIYAKINEVSGSLFVEKIGTLYPVLHAMEKQKYLKSYVMKRDGKSRKYYKLTKKQGGVQHEK